MTMTNDPSGGIRTHHTKDGDFDASFSRIGVGDFVYSIHPHTAPPTQHSRATSAEEAQVLAERAIHFSMPHDCAEMHCEDWVFTWN
jgi:hypothetical protein